MHACPNCGSSDGLWLGVTISAFRTVDAWLEPYSELDYENCDTEQDGTAGCSDCSWSGKRDELVQRPYDGDLSEYEGDGDDLTPEQYATWAKNA